MITGRYQVALRVSGGVHPPLENWAATTKALFQQTLSFCIIQAGICHCGTYPPPLAHTNSTDKGGDKFPRNVLARSVFFYTFNKRIIFLHKELQYSGHWAVPPSLFNLRSMFFNALGLHYSV